MENRYRPKLGTGIGIGIALHFGREHRASKIKHRARSCARDKDKAEEARTKGLLLIIVKVHIVRGKESDETEPSRKESLPLLSLVFACRPERGLSVRAPTLTLPPDAVRGDS